MGALPHQSLLQLVQTPEESPRLVPLQISLTLLLLSYNVHLNFEIKETLYEHKRS